MQTKLIHITVTLSCLLLSQLALADKNLEYRQGVMNIFSWNLKPMSAVVKGEAPYDAEKFSRHARDLAAAANLDLLAGFPEGSDEGETDAKGEIWFDWKDFSAKFSDLKEKSAALEKAAASGDINQIRPAFGATARTCKQCHKQYKE